MYVYKQSRVTMLPVQFNCSLDTVVLNKDIPKTVVPHQKTLSLFTLSPPPPKDRYFSGTYKMYIE